MNALTVIRKLHMSDLLLPVGAALVTAGIEALGQRERRQRDRLAALQASVSQHVDALLAAGAPVPDELLVDELHPFDAPGLAPDYGITDTGNPKTSSNSYPDGGENSSGGRGRGWKLAALALVAGTATYAYVRREQIGRHVTAVMAAAGVDDELAAMTPDAGAAPGPWTGDNCDECGQPIWWFVDEQTWRHVVPGHEQHPYARWSSHVAVPPPAINEAAPAPWDHAEPVNEPLTADRVNDGLTGCEYCGHPHDPAISPHPAGPAPAAVADEPSEVLPAGNLPDGDRPAEPSDEKSSGDGCGWEGCTWQPKSTTRGAARVAALALHRSRCPYRPPSMTVPGA